MVSFLDAHLFEIAILIISGVLIPIGLIISTKLGKILTNTTNIISSLTSVAEGATTMSQALTEAHLRDRDFTNQLTNIEEDVKTLDNKIDTCRTEVNNQITQLSNQLK